MIFLNVFPRTSFFQTVEGRINDTNRVDLSIEQWRNCQYESGGFDISVGTQVKKRFVGVLRAGDGIRTRDPWLGKPMLWPAELHPQYPEDFIRISPTNQTRGRGWFSR